MLIPSLCQTINKIGWVRLGLLPSLDWWKKIISETASPINKTIVYRMETDYHSEKVQRCTSTEKIMTTFFFDCEGIVYTDFFPRGSTIIAQLIPNTENIAHYYYMQEALKVNQRHYFHS